MPRFTSRLLSTQPAIVRGVFPVSANRSIIVRNDPELVEDSDYAPGVMESLREAWNNNDYFLVELVDKQGHVIESVGSMAGYGSPKKAAAAALKDYWKKR
jgi:hypothetical protein